jgi:hypothetical protein
VFEEGAFFVTSQKHSVSFVRVVHLSCLSRLFRKNIAKTVRPSSLIQRTNPKHQSIQPITNTQRTHPSLCVLAVEAPLMII